MLRYIWNISAVVFCIPMYVSMPTKDHTNALLLYVYTIHKTSYLTSTQNMKVDELNDTPNSSISKNNPNPYVHNILHQIISTLPHQSYTMMNEQYVIYHLSNISPKKISRRPLYSAPPQPQPSIFHVNTLSWLWGYKVAKYFVDILVPYIAKGPLFRHSSQIQASNISSANSMYID